MAVTSQKHDQWHDASIAWMPIDHPSKLPGFVKVVKLLLSTDERVAKFNSHLPYQLPGHKFIKAKYQTVSWPKMLKDQQDKFAYMYESTPIAWKKEAVKAFERDKQTIETNVQQQPQLTQTHDVSSSDLVSSAASMSSTSHDNTNQDDMVRLCHMLADSSPYIKQLFVDYRTPIPDRATLDNRDRVRPETSLALAFNNPQVLSFNHFFGVSLLISFFSSHY